MDHTLILVYHGKVGKLQNKILIEEHFTTRHKPHRAKITGRNIRTVHASIESAAPSVTDLGTRLNAVGSNSH